MFPSHDREGRNKQRIRVTVEDTFAIEDDGLTVADTVIQEGISTTAEAYNYGQSELKSRNTPTRVTFRTYEPGLEPATEIDVVDSSRGLNETLIIDRVKVKFIGGGYAIFDVECGERSADFTDLFKTTHNLAEPKVKPDTGKTDYELRTLWDANLDNIRDRDWET